MENATLEYLNNVWELRDKRMDTYLLMNQPLMVLSFCVFYIVSVTKILPFIMSKYPKPFTLRYLMLFYNFCLCLGNLYLIYTPSGFWSTFNFRWVIFLVFLLSF